MGCDSSSSHAITCDHTIDVVVPAFERSSFSLQSENTLLCPALCMQLRRLHLMRSWTGGAAARFYYVLHLQAACSHTKHHADGPWQPYPNDTCGPLVVLTVLA